MNIFMVDKSPLKSAQMLHNRHVVKMLLEVAQLLSTAHAVLDNNGLQVPGFYKPTHKNHPSAKWARENAGNYIWLYAHFIHLCAEYSHRYEKTHATWTKMGIELSRLPVNIDPKTDITEMPQCMPDEYKVPGDPVQGYRNYYNAKKVEGNSWKNREIPDWVIVPPAKNVENYH
jgi:Pyrimidine dimer DNA glycosylase